jgi:hypothetical protein
MKWLLPFGLWFFAVVVAAFLTLGFSTLDKVASGPFSFDLTDVLGHGELLPTIIGLSLGALATLIVRSKPGSGSTRATHAFVGMVVALVAVAASYFLADVRGTTHPNIQAITWISCAFYVIAFLSGGFAVVQSD